MPKAFDFSHPPFDRLRPTEIERVNRVIDIVFLRTGQTVLSAGTVAEHFYVVIKGLIEERADGEVVAVHESGDGFDGGVLVHQTVRHDFTVREEAICYVLPIADFLDLAANNAAFAGFFANGIGGKVEVLEQRRQSAQTIGSMTLRVRQAPINPPVFVPPATRCTKRPCIWTVPGSVLCWCGTELGSASLPASISSTRRWRSGSL